MRHAFVLFLVACSAADGGTEGDAASSGGGTDGGTTDGGTTGGTDGGTTADTDTPGGTEPTPTVPAVAAGEIALYATIDGEVVSVLCEPGNPSAHVVHVVDFHEAADLFSLTCGAVDSDPRAYFSLAVRESDFVVGDVALGGGDALTKESSTIFVTDANGDGYHASLDGNEGAELVGVLHLDAHGGPGERVAGSFEYTWEVTSIVEDGTVLPGEPMPGRAVGAFDLVLP